VGTMRWKWMDGTGNLHGWELLLYSECLVRPVYAGLGMPW